MGIRKYKDRKFIHVGAEGKLDINAEYAALRSSSTLGDTLAKNVTLVRFVAKEVRKNSGKATRNIIVQNDHSVAKRLFIDDEKPNPIELLYEYYFGRVCIRNGTYCVDGKYVGMSDIYQMVNKVREEQGEHLLPVPDFFRK